MRRLIKCTQNAKIYWVHFFGYTSISYKEGNIFFNIKILTFYFFTVQMLQQLYILCVYRTQLLKSYRHPNVMKSSVNTLLHLVRFPHPSISFGGILYMCFIPYYPVVVTIKMLVNLGLYDLGFTVDVWSEKRTTHLHFVNVHWVVCCPMLASEVVHSQINRTKLSIYQ